MKMAFTVTSKAFFLAFAIIFLAFSWMILNWVWLKPKKLEKLLRQQGFSGNSYRIFHGDMKDMYRMMKEARAKPINLSDDIAPRIMPFDHHIIQKYGMTKFIFKLILGFVYIKLTLVNITGRNSFIWKGTTPSINITDPKLIREVFFKNDIFQKSQRNLLGKLVVNGMVMYEGEQWHKVRKIANPAFYQDKLKVLFYLYKVYFH